MKGVNGNTGEVKKTICLADKTKALEG